LSRTGRCDEEKKKMQSMMVAFRAAMTRPGELSKPLPAKDAPATATKRDR
jgi:hypothetical protein